MMCNFSCKHDNYVPKVAFTIFPHLPISSYFSPNAATYVPKVACTIFPSLRLSRTYFLLRINNMDLNLLLKKHMIFLSF
jgi:hypothetical protein